MKVETLMENQREEFSRIVNILLAENCVYQYNKIKNFEKKERNEDYTFISDHWEYFDEYLRYAGWILQKDRSSYMGMIYITNEREDCACKYQLNMLETMFLLILRNYYEEKMLELDASLTIRITTNELLRLLVDVFALVSSKPSSTMISSAIMTLQRLNVVQRYHVEEEEYLWVLPYITCVLTPEHIDHILKNIHNEEEGDEDETEENAID
ncbi:MULTISPECIES: DUF4194 domain-containing protein [unclassified Amedibacterium]|uniref:DUF4194 domain-containing protein n=1 Tax=unclassified Amedibacterium TaxID=3088137 RepID=UPI000E3F67BB|nr:MULTISPECIES: DUF4194 domain-containing protein [unclassified Absiella]RGB65510.1 DUF4194 domain-containing protein [Absiella sp. AM09-45]RGB74496.1 DUF4194 domain-containing protein [Absiella sp. AM09-50]RGC53223.1 DUF4194 domain-containing protein [Absiella sp. AM29-15]